MQFTVMLDINIPDDNFKSCPEGEALEVFKQAFADEAAERLSEAYKMIAFLDNLPPALEVVGRAG